MPGPITKKSPPPAVRPKRRPPKLFFLEFLADMAGTQQLSKQKDLALLAAGLAFFCLFSLIPFLILSFLGSRYMIGAERTSLMLHELGSVLEGLIPAMDARIFRDLVSVLKHNIATDLFNLSLLGWATYGLFTCLHTVFSKMSTHGRERNAFWFTMVSVGCFLLAMASSTGFLFLSTNPGFLRDISGGSLEMIPLSEIRLLASGVSLCLVVACVTLVYKLMPTQKVSTMHAFRGSILFLTLFLIGRATYHVYLMYYRYMNEQTYGTFFTVLVLTAWIYYLARIFLFSAQYAIFLQDKADRS